jgi:Transferase family
VSRHEPCLQIAGFRNNFFVHKEESIEVHRQLTCARALYLTDGGMTLASGSANATTRCCTDHSQCSTGLRFVCRWYIHSLNFICVFVSYVQVTYLADGGVALAFRINHQVCDGRACFVLARMWGKLHRRQHQHQQHVQQERQHKCQQQGGEPQQELAQQQQQQSQQQCSTASLDELDCSIDSGGGGGGGGGGKGTIIAPLMHDRGQLIAIAEAAEAPEQLESYGVVGRGLQTFTGDGSHALLRVTVPLSALLFLGLC